MVKCIYDLMENYVYDGETRITGRFTKAGSVQQLMDNEYSGQVRKVFYLMYISDRRDIRSDGNGRVTFQDHTRDRVGTPWYLFSKTIRRNYRDD